MADAIIVEVDLAGGADGYALIVLVEDVAVGTCDYEDALVAGRIVAVITDAYSLVVEVEILWANNAIDHALD